MEKDLSREQQKVYLRVHESQIRRYKESVHSIDEKIENLKKQKPHFSASETEQNVYKKLLNDLISERGFRSSHIRLTRKNLRDLNKNLQERR